jgi:hypothetical protein
VRYVVIALVAAALMASCGSDHRAIDANGKRLLTAEIAGARQAAAAGDMARASALLSAVDDTVHGLRARDMITDQRAAEVLAALGSAQDALRKYAGTASTTTTTPRVVTAPPNTVPAPAPNHGNGHGKGHGNDKGDED